jgi:hypothetical protein
MADSRRGPAAQTSTHPSQNPFTNELPYEAEINPISPSPPEPEDKNVLRGVFSFGEPMMWVPQQRGTWRLPLAGKTRTGSWYHTRDIFTAAFKRIARVEYQLETMQFAKQPPQTSKTLQTTLNNDLKSEAKVLRELIEAAYDSYQEGAKKCRAELQAHLKPEHEEWIRKFEWEVHCVSSSGKAMKLVDGGVTIARGIYVFADIRNSFFVSHSEDTVEKLDNDSWARRLPQRVIESPFYGWRRMPYSFESTFRGRHLEPDPAQPDLEAFQLA